jgi:hypothetical protein
VEIDAGGLGRVVLLRQRIDQQRSLQIINHPADPMRLQHVPAFGVSAGAPHFHRVV